MCKDRLVYVVQMVIVVIEAIVVNQVIWYVIKFDFNFDKKMNDFMSLQGIDGLQGPKGEKGEIGAPGSQVTEQRK